MRRNIRTFIIILFIYSSLLLKATEQIHDLLILKSDTIYIDKFPLEILSEQDSIIAKRLNDTTCLSMDCWRQYIGIWKIENDSLFLIGLKDCCDNKEIPLNKVFNESEIKNGKVFANWYSDNIKSGFGKWLAFDEDNWQNIYEKNIELEIVNGKIEKCAIQTTKPKNDKNE
jgi:hypothetical protein